MKKRHEKKDAKKGRKKGQMENDLFAQCRIERSSVITGGLKTTIAWNFLCTTRSNADNVLYVSLHKYLCTYMHAYSKIIYYNLYIKN